MNKSATATTEAGLYSPPQINRRLPKKEPRPRQGKSMTIAAGFRCRDGVVLCTDSEHTAGQSKFYDHKIFQAEAANAVMYVAGAGDDLYIRSAAREIESEVQGKSLSFDQIEVAAEKAVSMIYKEHFAIAHQASDPSAPTMTLLLAAQVEGEKEARLYRIRETGGITQVGPGVSVVGTEAAESLMRALSDLFFGGYSQSVYAMRYLAVHMIHRVIRSASYCGGSPQIACLTDQGARYVETTADADLGHDYLAGTFLNMPDILEAHPESPPGNCALRFPAGRTAELKSSNKV